MAVGCLSIPVVGYSNLFSTAFDLDVGRDPTIRISWLLLVHNHLSHQLEGRDSGF